MPKRLQERDCAFHCQSGIWFCVLPMGTIWLSQNIILGKKFFLEKHRCYFNREDLACEHEYCEAPEPDPASHHPESRKVLISEILSN